MSIKIYTGFQFKHKNLMQIHREIMKFRKEARALAERKAAQWQIKKAVEILDRFTLGGGKKEFRNKVKTDGPFYMAFSELMERQREIEKTKQRDPEVDFSFELSIHPLRNKVLGMYFAEDRDLIDLWMSKSFVVDYHYQNQTDKPRDIDAKEWRQRARDWDRALPGAGVPAESGFTAQVTGMRVAFLGREGSIWNHIPKLNDRARAFAKTRLFQKRFKELKRKREKEVYDGKRVSMKALPVSDWSAVYFAFGDWLKTREGKKALAAEMKEVKKNLVKRVTKAHLLGKRFA